MLKQLYHIYMFIVLVIKKVCVLEMNPLQPSLTQKRTLVYKTCYKEYICYKCVKCKQDYVLHYRKISTQI